MMREETVFGPIYSRRLGSSLGINLLPQKGKLCNFDCIYCECGWNRDGRGDTVLPTAEDLQKALTSKLEACKAAGTPIDSITFSGDGEPTLNPEFAQIIDVTLSLRDAYYPAAKVSVLSNATRVGREDVFHALRKVDNPILKIDAPTDALAAKYCAVMLQASPTPARRIITPVSWIISGRFPSAIPRSMILATTIGTSRSKSASSSLNSGARTLSFR